MRKRQQGTRFTKRGKGRRGRRTSRHTLKRRQKGGAGPSLFLYTLTNGAGFFSNFFFLCSAYIQAKKSGQAFKIDHADWQYTFKDGWRDYFDSLEVATPEEAAKAAQKGKHGSLPFHGQQTVQEYIDCIKEIYKLKPGLLQRAKEFKVANGLEGAPYTSLYIRRGDKTNGDRKEMSLFSVEEILKKGGLLGGAPKPGVSPSAQHLFIQTDDYTVVEEVKALLPSTKVVTMTAPSTRGADLFKTRAMTPEEKKAHAEELLSSIEVLLGGDVIWTDSRSNVGRFHKLAAFEKVKFYSEEGGGANPPLDKMVSPYSSL